MREILRLTKKRLGLSPALGTDSRGRDGCNRCVTVFDVLSRTLVGMTSEGIALDLGVSLNTVLTYRKRAYARLGVSSQAELFSLCIA